MIMPGLALSRQSPKRRFRRVCRAAGRMAAGNGLGRFYKMR
jgi:hypothetical protein